MEVVGEKVLNLNTTVIVSGMEVTILKFLLYTLQSDCPYYEGDESGCSTFKTQCNREIVLSVGMV